MAVPEIYYGYGKRYRLVRCYMDKFLAKEEAADLRTFGYNAVVREYEKPHRFCIYRRRK